MPISHNSPGNRWPYTAPHLTANVKQEMCAEFDKTLERLIDASGDFFQAAFQIDYLLDNIDECRFDDLERYGRLRLIDSPSLRQRLGLGGKAFVDKCLELNEQLEDIRLALFDGNMRLPNPDDEDKEDNDSPTAVPNRFKLVYPTGGDDCSSE